MPQLGSPPLSTFVAKYCHEILCFNRYGCTYCHIGTSCYYITINDVDKIINNILSKGYNSSHTLRFYSSFNRETLVEYIIAQQGTLRNASSKDSGLQSGIMVHICYSCTWEDEADCEFEASLS